MELARQTPALSPSPGSFAPEGRGAGEGCDAGGQSQTRAESLARAEKFLDFAPTYMIHGKPGFCPLGLV